MAKNIIIPAPYDTWLNLNDAAKAMGYKHAQYVRRLLIEKKFGTYGEDYVKMDMGSYKQWLVNPESCEGFRDGRASGSSTFGQHAIRRYLVRFATAEVTEEQVLAALKAGLGDPGTKGEDDFRWEFAPAWDGKNKNKKKSGKPAKVETVQARILASLTGDDDDDDEVMDDDRDFAEDDEEEIDIFSDDDEDEDDDVLA